MFCILIQHICIYLIKIFKMCLLLLLQAQKLAAASAWRYSVFKTHCCCTNSIYKITYSRSIQVELGKGFRRTLRTLLGNSQVNANQPFKGKHAASSLVAYATRTDQLVPSHLMLWISSVTLRHISLRHLTFHEETRHFLYLHAFLLLYMNTWLIKLNKLHSEMFWPERFE